MRTVIVLLILTAAAIPALFRNSVSTIRSGNELTALSWVLAERSGNGSISSSFYPLVFTIEEDSAGLLAVIQGSPETRPPEPPLPEGVPFPAQYLQQGSTVTIRFSEVP